MKPEDRPTPETDALVKAKKAKGFLKFARRLERERDEARELCDFNAKQLLVAVNERNSLVVQRDRLLEAISLALRTNGGPIDGTDTTDGEAYVMVRACAFAGLEAAIAEVKGAK